MDGDINRQAELSELDARLLNEFQRDFPLCPRPYAEIAERMGVEEEAVIEAFGRLQSESFLTRIGAVVTPHKAGWSTLAAMSVPEDELVEVAAIVSEVPGVNHNYERDHLFNLWFVLTGPDQETVENILTDIEHRTDIKILNLPLVEAYRLDLGFPIEWN